MVMFVKYLLRSCAIIKYIFDNFLFRGKGILEKLSKPCFFIDFENRWLFFPAA